MPNVTQSITESDPGWILRGTQGINKRNQNGVQALQIRQYNDLQPDSLHHSKSVNLFGHEPQSHWAGGKGTTLHSILGGNSTMVNKGSSISINNKNDNSEVRSAIGDGPSTFSNNLLEPPRHRAGGKQGPKDGALVSNSVSNFDQIDAHTHHQSLTPNHNLIK